MTTPPRPHHDGSPLYVSTQSPELGSDVTLRLRVPEDYPHPESVFLRSNPDQEPHWDTAYDIGTANGWRWWEVKVTVANPRHRYRWLLLYQESAGPGPTSQVEWLNQAGLHSHEVLDSDDFSLLATPGPPHWLHDAVMYQIFPDRFARSAEAADRPVPEWAQPAQWDDPIDPRMPGRGCQVYGGDLNGVIERLDHLDALGVGVIYLTPFFPAASNHRYDATSFDRVDPLLGGNGALIQLVEAAHQRNIRVIGDLTTNHSGDQHEWFQRASADPESPERGFYYFADGGVGADYESWLGEETLPKLNWSSPRLRHTFIEGPDSVVAQWLKPPYNLDGWRIDVANMTGRLGDIDLNAEVRQTIRRTMLEAKPDSILLAEYANDGTADLTGDSWHGAMTYPSFTRPLWNWLSAPDGSPYLTGEGKEETTPWYFGQPLGGIPQATAEEFASAVERFNGPIPWRVRLANMNALDSHDTARFATNAAAGTLELAVGLQMTLPGLPALFAGDEFGLTGADGELSRTPIPWERAQEPEYADTLALYRGLTELRRRHPALGIGGMRWLYADSRSVVFVRESATESILVHAAAPGQDQRSRVRVPAAALTDGGQITRIWGAAELDAGEGVIEMTARGPCFSVWELPGVTPPAVQPQHHASISECDTSGASAS